MNYSAQTNSNGQAVLTMNDGSYRFAKHPRAVRSTPQESKRGSANVNGVHFWSGESNHCTVPGCSSAEITITDPITVTVMDTDENPKAGINVLAFVGSTYIGVSKTTDTNGQAIFTLHEGSYRFQALVDNIAFWSGETNHCTVPGCETAGITVTNPVTVTVQDTASQPKAGLLVTAFNGSTPIPTGRFTNENGQANLTLPMGSYRFRVNYNGTNFWSGTVNHCTVPGCTSAQITVPGPIPVTVLDSDETPQVGLPVYAFNGETYAGVSGTTDSNGRVLLTLQNGSYRFRTELNGVSFWSGTVNHCTVPGCTGASITVTKPLTVHVEDTQAEARAGLTVRIYDGSNYTTYSEVTDENGDAQFTLPAGSYRVRVDYNEAIFWSGVSNHCTLPGCEQVNVVVNQPVTVSVKGVDGSPFEGTLVELYRGEVLVTNDDMSNAEGEITFTLNDGSYRFAANVSGTRFWSGEVDHCVIPGCTEAVITLPGGQNGVIEHAISYEYDPLYRLTEANYDDGIYFHYQYDAVGNRLSEEKKLEAELPEIVNNYEYDIANRLIEVNSLEYEWDDNGNLLDDGVSLYSYDFNNKLLEITKGTDTFSYAYNGLGDRLSQTVNEVTTDYVLDIQSSLTQVLQNGTNTYLYGVNRVAEFSDTEEEYYLADALGSVRNLTNDSGLVTLGQSFTPYGEVLETYGSAQTDYAYTGEMYDPLTGLVYLRARYYAPGDGRFVSKDVWAGEYTHPLSLNRWSYVAANPVNFIDPTGLWRWYLTEPMYHLPIEDYYESMSGFNPNRQLEYPIPGTPFRHPDMFNSLIGEVYEIEPIYLRSSGSIQVQGYVTDLKKAAVVNLLSGSHLLGGSFDWNQTFFHVGAGIDWPGKFRKSPLNSFFPFVDLVADYVGNGVVAYWLEPNVNAPVIVGKPVEGLVPNRRLLRSRNWTPGAPSYQPAYAVEIGTVCGAVLIAAGGTLLLVTIVEDATVLGVVDDIVTVPGGYFLINYGLKLATFSPVP